jgi:hypothetical protein
MRLHHKEKAAIESRFLCGATEIRTRDTRIFSPLLYQLSYGTLCWSFLTNRIAKVGFYSISAKKSVILAFRIWKRRDHMFKYCYL